MKQLGFNTHVKPLVGNVKLSGILLSPKKIYYEWFRWMIPETDYRNMDQTEFFLLPHFGSPVQAEEFCSLFFDLFFQYKLRKCTDDPSFWPVNRTYEMFQEWFEIRIAPDVSTMI